MRTLINTENESQHNPIIPLLMRMSAFEGIRQPGFTHIPGIFSTNVEGIGLQGFVGGGTYLTNTVQIMHSKDIGTFYEPTMLNKYQIRIPVSPIETEPNILCKDDIHIINSFRTIREEIDFDIDARLVHPEGEIKYFKVKLIPMGKIPPSITFDPENE